MPLHKLTNIPKIPKTRKKKPHAALTAIPSKKPDKLEYYCKVFFKYDPQIKKQYEVFAIETVVEFTSFAYEISVEVIKEKHVINLVVMGLKAIMDSVPQIMPARNEILFEELYGDYTVNVVKQDGAINTGEFSFNLFKKEIILNKQYKPKKKNNRLFCEFQIAQDEFTFPE